MYLKFATESGIALRSKLNLQVILKTSNENVVEKNLVQDWYHLLNIVICKPPDRGIE